MKRIFILIFTILTLVMTFSGCQRAAFVPQKIGAAVSFTAKDYHCKGDFLFEKEGIKRFTISEPAVINGCFAEEKNGRLCISYDGISVEIQPYSPLKRLFSIVEDFTSREHKIPHQGIEMIMGIPEEGSYEIEFDCSKKRIVKIITEDTQYIFQ